MAIGPSLKYRKCIEKIGYQMVRGRIDVEWVSYWTSDWIAYFQVDGDVKYICGWSQAVYYKCALICYQMIQINSC